MDTLLLCINYIVAALGGIASWKAGTYAYGKITNKEEATISPEVCSLKHTHLDNELQDLQHMLERIDSKLDRIHDLVIRNNIEIRDTLDQKFESHINVFHRRVG